MSLREIGCTFLGANCSQSWADFYLWEKLLNEHPELKSIVELGTGEGGFSRYLSIQAEARGIEFATFDCVHMDVQNAPGFQMLDIFAQPNRVVERLSSPALLFCDDGQKTREVDLFAPLLVPGDLLVVHDWNVEIVLGDIPEMLSPIHEDWWGTTAVFERGSS
jgi:cephalosporin hydroxylase